jgi:MFS transporter, PAT family, beta-lactamase induction signal transducer AmpG
MEPNKSDSIWKALISRRMLSVLWLGISSGLPLLLIGSTFKAWMKESNVDLTTIGLFASVMTPYSLKFLWSPLIDRYALQFLDRRRSWIFIMQVCLSAMFFAISLHDPLADQGVVVMLAVVTAVFAATQDIAIDAYRREVLDSSELGLGSSMAINGYRIGMLIAGAGALALADQVGWNRTYQFMAGCMVLCTVFTIFAPKISGGITAPRTLKDAVILPFVDYFKRKGAIEILIFIFLYKVGDQMASDMLTPFYLSVGFTKTEIAVISKGFGFWATILGGFVGGMALVRYNLVKCLWVFGIFQALTTACFSWLALKGNDNAALSLAVFLENFASGMGTSAFSAFMAGLCNRQFTATQYALLSSFMGVPRALLGSSSGFVADRLGWFSYFIFCTVVAVPGLIMLFRAKSWLLEPDVKPESSPIDV